MACNFSTMLNRLKNYPKMIAYRKGWEDDRWLYVGTMPNRRQALYQHEGVHSDPYSVQQTDLFANDWEVEDG